MYPVAVLQAFDVLEDISTELSACRPGLAVNELLLDRGEEALGGRVGVSAATGSSEDNCHSA